MYCWGSYVTRTVASSTCTPTSSESSTPHFLYCILVSVCAYTFLSHASSSLLIPPYSSSLAFNSFLYISCSTFSASFFLSFPSFFSFSSSISLPLSSPFLPYFPVYSLSVTYSPLPSTYLTLFYPISYQQLSQSSFPLLLSFPLFFYINFSVSRTMHDANALINSLMKLAVLEIQSQLEVITHMHTNTHTLSLSASFNIYHRLRIFLPSSSILSLP